MNEYRDVRRVHNIIRGHHVISPLPASLPPSNPSTTMFVNEAVTSREKAGEEPLFMARLDLRAPHGNKVRAVRTRGPFNRECGAWETRNI
jgi:hypothetical protein